MTSPPIRAFQYYLAEQIRYILGIVLFFCQQIGHVLPNQTKIRVDLHVKIAERVGVSDRTLEKIRTIKEASTEGDFIKEVWKKVALVK